MILSAFVAVMALVTCAGANVPRTLRLSTSHLAARAVPAACTSTCTASQNDLSRCSTDVTCLCTDSVARDLAVCAVCQAQQDPSTTSQLELAWEQYSTGCCALGMCVDVDGSLSATEGGVATDTPSTSRIAAATTSTPEAILTTSTPTSVPAFLTSPSPVITASGQSTTSSALSGGGDSGSSNSGGGAAGGLGTGGSPNGASSSFTAHWGTAVGVVIAAMLL